MWDLTAISAKLDDFVIYFAEFIYFSCDFQPILIFRESADLYVFIT